MFQELKDSALFEKATTYGIAYLDNSLERNVFPTNKALDDMSIFDEDLSEDEGSAELILDMLHTFGSPATISQIGGRYFGFVCGGVVPAGLIAKNLATFWDQNSALNVLSPIASKLESVVQKWLIDLLGLPDKTVAGFVSGTSMANFCGLAAARYRVLQNQGWDIAEQGFYNAPPIRMITGKDAHSTILKAISLIGIGKSNIEWVDVDDQGRIIPELIPELDESSILVLQAGNVNSGAFDHFDKICKLAQSKGAWIHIDGAFGLWAAGTENLKHLTNGYEFANSWAVDGHKTLNTPYDSGIILCNDENALSSSLHMSGGYIIDSQERDGMYFTPEMSRRARVIELWATLKYLGKNGVDEMITGFHNRAIQFAEEIENIEGFIVLNEVVFNQVLVGCKSDQVTNSVIKRIQESGECWVGGSWWKGKKVIRVSICSWTTTSADITKSIVAFKNALHY